MMNNEYADVFKEETYEILEELESSLLELEANPADSDIVAKIFRAIHTIKGSGAMFGFDMISAFAHQVENAYELVRQGNLIADKKLIDLTLSARDFIKTALETDGENLDQVSLEQKQTILDGIKSIVDNAGNAPPTPEPEPVQPPPKVEEPPQIMQAEPDDDEDDEEPEQIDVQALFDQQPIFNSQPVVKQERAAEAEAPGRQARRKAAQDNDQRSETTYRIRFVPSPEILEKGTEITLLLKELSELGESKAVAHLAGVPVLEDINPLHCYVSWDIILTTRRSKNAIRDIFIFVEDDSEIDIELIDSADTMEAAEYKKVGNILVEKGDLKEEIIEEVESHKKKLGEILVEEGAVEVEDVEAALMEQQHVREIRKKRQDTETASSLRVSSEKVDQLVNLVGELVTLQARLSQLSQMRNDAEMISLAEEVERITWELRDNSMDMRMLPIGSTFSRFKRLVRDLSNNLGKEVDLTFDGGDTELDKTVIEKLNDPLVHIIRNSIDHGVEIPDKRMAAGKPRVGNIYLNAFHSGSNVVIQVSDDGAGLDTERILKKAIERGLVAADQEINTRDIFNLVFEPGFSTAKEVSDVSGRGVGMDVVKRNIEALRGSIDIDSDAGEGTMFTLNIPLTLAIIDGLLVQIADEFFVFPLSMVESCIEIRHSDIAESNGQHYVNVRGDIVPYIYLREQFDIDNKCPPIEQIVITDIEKRRVGFVVDHVIGGHQTVIKSLGKVYKHIDGISGATILGDGTIALILDIPKLVMITGLAKKRYRSRSIDKS